MNIESIKQYISSKYFFILFICGYLVSRTRLQKKLISIGQISGKPADTFSTF